uniref:Uncharacterized protein n=1 Tax=Glossina brevipalpis TaxID=37001 RepID=A0A1A9WFB7_9MUSC
MPKLVTAGKIVSNRLITGAMGKGLAVLTFDDEYQRKRRQILVSKPKTFHEGMAGSGKGLVMRSVNGGILRKEAFSIVLGAFKEELYPIDNVNQFSKLNINIEEEKEKNFLCPFPD